MKSNIYTIMGDRELKDVAKKSRINYNTLMGWQSYGCKIYAKFKRLANTLGCSVDDLFTLEDYEK